MDIKKLLKGLNDLYFSTKTDTYTLKEIFRVLMESCSIKNKGDKVLLAELRALASQAKEVITATSTNSIAVDVDTKSVDTKKPIKSENDGDNHRV